MQRIYFHTDINLVKKKFENSTKIVAENIDILCVTETKLDETVRSNQFLIISYNKPYDLDVAARNEGILVYSKQSYSHFLQFTRFEVSNNIKVKPFALNLRKVWSFVSVS